MDKSDGTQEPPVQIEWRLNRWQAESVTRDVQIAINALSSISFVKSDSIEQSRQFLLWLREKMRHHITHTLTDDASP